jgi:methylase of polypeptide subunit release factors
VIATLAPDRTSARALGAALRRIGFDEDGIEELLGDDAYGGGPEQALVGERRLPDSPLGTAVRVLFLERAVPTVDLVRAIGQRAVDALASTGLAEVGDTVEPRARIIPVRGLLLASDGEWDPGASDSAGYVATYTPTAHFLDSLTPRSRVERALDVGTGNGIHALLAARHARHVIATDVNERAIAYTEINAALNDLDNVECRAGSLFEPVEGERFDLITCNAPYVVSPENRLVYRDGGLEGDALSEQVVRGTAEHLKEGGYAAMLASWIARDPDAPDEHVLAWVDETDCDSWILADIDATPLDHAAGWNSDLAEDTQAFQRKLDDWTKYFEDLGVSSVTEGAILLHRRSEGPEPTVRTDVVDSDEVEEAGDQVERAFEARARLAELERDADLLDERVGAAMAMRLELDLDPRRGSPVVSESRVLLLDGTQQVVEGSAEALELIGLLDAGQPLAASCDAVVEKLGLSPAAASRLRRDAVELCTELLELGALRIL